MRTRAWTRGYTLVELMITVSIIGVLASLAVMGITKYLHIANASEAKQVVGSISRAAALAYEVERSVSQIVGEGTQSAASSNQLCESAAPVPATYVGGRKYQPNTATGVDWDTGSPATGWRCLRFSMSQPIYYQYLYAKGSGYKAPAVGGPDPTANGFEAAAIGDLDNDGTLATLARSGKILPTGALTLSTHVFVDKEAE